MPGVFLIVVALGSATVAAQGAGKAANLYDPSTEVTVSGVITAVVSVTSPEGTVGVHMNVKDATGQIVKVQVGPALFIGMNNFFFFAEETVSITGAYVARDGALALWARQITKDGKTLTLRNPDGAPRWPLATAEDPDGCGVSHAPVRY
jgi:hypothetical protein